MKNLLRSLAVLIVLGLTTSWLAAQNAAADSKSKSETRTITGCLAKGDETNEFKLMGSDGSNWDLRSDNVALADHVGHTVTVTGVVAHSKMHNLKEDTKDAAKDAGVKKDNSESGDLTVTDLQMVSNSCK